MKSVDEIMKGLEEELPVHYHIDGEPRLTPRQYMELQRLHKDALALIRRLDKAVVEAEKHANTLYDQKDALESKLNQAVEDIRILGRTGEFICPVCAHYNHGEGTSGECVKCLTGDGFRWRGEKEEDK